MSVAAPPEAPGALLFEEASDDPIAALIEEARQRARRRRRRSAGAALLVLLLGGPAAYLGYPHSGGADAASVDSPSGRNALTARELAKDGPLTILAATGSDGIATVETVGRGRPQILWRCPGDYFCGEPVSHDWAPDGKRLAVTFDEVALDYSYPLSLHVIDVESGRDIQIPTGSTNGTTAKLRLGCRPPTELDWSPDGTRLAYRCGSVVFGRRADYINVIAVSGAGYRAGSSYRTIPVPGAAFWPSWSPSGGRIAYSTSLGLNGRAAVYAVDLDGAHRKLLATNATAPAWSPDGTRIAYESSCGLRLVTPAGQDATPRRAGKCRAVGPVGRPTWSPDGSKIAVATTSGTYVINADGSRPQLVSHQTSTAGPLDWSLRQPERPSWRPRPHT